MQLLASRKLRSAAYVFGVWLTLISATTANELELNANPPDHYTVVPGDTLWGVSERFLRDPWRWPEIWKGNPEIKNPHLIYPGDVIVLRYTDGAPELHLQRGNGVGSTIKLSPEVRSSTIVHPIPTIPVDTIRQFLTQPRVVTREEMANAPYVLAGADEHVIMGAGDSVYVRGLTQPDTRRLMIYRLGSAYRDAPAGVVSTLDKDILGYEALYIGEASLVRNGDPATLAILRSSSEVRRGDRLLPIDEQELEQVFQPHAPGADAEGRIIAVVNGVSRIGQGQIVVLNRGTQQGIEIGHVFAVYQAGQTIQDPLGKIRGERVALPDERAGTVMVFRSFERVSYALVMQAKGPMHLYDMVKTP
jgi:LysM repeat protein